MCRSALIVAVLLGLGVPCTLYADSLRGVVHDADGKPISNARVDIASAAPREGRQIFCPSCYHDCEKRTRTNDKGEFLLEGLDPKLKFRIFATFPGKQTGTTDLLDPLQDSPTIVLADFPADVSPDRMIIGRVISKEGTPIAGALLEPYGAKTGEGHSIGQIQAQTALTNDQGHFQTLLSADYKGIDFTVRADGYAGTKTGLLSPGVEPHEIVLPMGATVTGQIVVGALPQQGVMINVVQTNRSLSGHFIQSISTVTDEDGRFEFHHLPASQQYAIFSRIYGTVPVSTSAEVPPILVTKLFQCRGDSEQRDLGPLELQPGLRLSGMISMSDGSHLPEGLKLRLDRDPVWDSIKVPVDREGRYAISGLPPETYEVIVNTDDLRIDASSQRFQLLKSNSIGIRLKQSLDAVDIKLERPKEVPGKIHESVQTGMAETDNVRQPVEASESHGPERALKKTLRPAAELTNEPVPENGPKLRVRGTVVASDGKPVESATIILQASSSTGRSAFLARTRTDANGRFTMAEVPIPLRLSQAITSLIIGDGGAQIVAFADGYGMAWAEVMSLEGETLKLTLGPEAKVYGNVRDETGDPVAKTQIKIVRIQNEKSGPIDEDLLGQNSLSSINSEVDFSASTDDKGEFVLHHVPATALLLLNVEHPQHELTSLLIETITSPGETDPNKRTYKTSRKTELVFVRSPLNIVIKREPTVLVRIMDESGIPIHSGAMQTYRKIDGSSNESNWSKITATSNAVTVRIPRPGRYTFMYNPDATTPHLGLEVNREITPAISGSTIELRTPQHQWITGRVVNAVTSQPIPGVRVLCWDPEQHGVARTFSHGISGTDGHFRIPATSGKKRISITGDYYGFLEVNGVNLDQHLNEIDVEVPVDRDVIGVTLHLMPGRIIKGRVTDSKHLPIQRAIVRAVSSGMPAFRDTATRSDADGRFELAGIPPDASVILYATSGTTTAWMKIPPSKANVEGDNSEVQLPLIPGSQFTGRMLKDGLPVKGIKLKLWRNLPGEPNRLRVFSTVTTNQEGRYTVGGLEPGDRFKFEIFAEDGSMAPDWRYQSPYVNNVAADHQGLRQLPDAHLITARQSLSGRIVDLDGNPLANVIITASTSKWGTIPRRDNAPFPWTKSDSLGNFLLEQLPDVPIDLLIGRALYEARLSPEMNQQGMRIVLDPSLREPLENLDP